MRVLVLSYHVPPDPAVGALRVTRVIEAFIRAGHEVEVIGPRGSGRAAELGAVRLHRVHRWPNARELALAVRQRLRRQRAPAAHIEHGDAGGYVPPQDVPGWKRFLVAMALMPDDQQGFILPAVARALRLMLARRYDLLYTSSPPHSAQVAGLLIKALTAIRWAAEFRDPWTDNASQRPRYARSEAAFTLKRWLERRCLAAADHVVVVTEFTGRAFAARMPDAWARIIVARNGIDPVTAPSPPRGDGPTRVLYLGSLYHGRDPRPFLAAVAKLLAQGVVARDRLRIDFYGDCRWYRDVDVARAAEQLGLGDVFRLHGHVTQPEAVRLAREADVLLLLAQDQPLQVPNKLYEYFQADRPILAFADARGETAQMLERVGGHFTVSTDDEDEVLAVVRQALRARDWKRPESADAVLASWSSQRQHDRMVAILAGPPIVDARARPMTPTLEAGAPAATRSVTGAAVAPSCVAAIVAANDLSGPGRQLAAVAGALRPLGIDLRVLLLRRTGHPHPEFADLLDRLNVQCEIVEDRGPLDPTLIRRVRNVLNAWSPDILQTHGYKATAIAWALRRGRIRLPWIGFFHGSTREAARAHLYHWLDRRMLRAADRIVVMSPGQQAEWTAHGDRIRLIHNAVVPLADTPGASDDRLRIASLLHALPRPRLAVIGRLSPEKGVDVFLRALADLRARGLAHTAIVAGDGPQRPALETLCQTLGLGSSVAFTGAVRAVDAVYAAIDLLVIPSHSEGLPNVLLEALAADVPVVATSVGAIPDVLADAAAGRLVPPAQPAALADAIVSVLAEPDAHAARMARRRTADRFSLGQRARAHLELYRDVLAQRSGAP